MIQSWTWRYEELLFYIFIVVEYNFPKTRDKIISKLRYL